MIPNVASIDDLTDEQVRDLTDEQIDWLIKRGMAEEGIPVHPLPVEPEYLLVPGPDLPTYHVAGEIFTDRDAAEDVQQTIARHSSSRVRLNYGRDYSVKFVESNDSSFQVTTVMVYSAAAYAEHKIVLEENATRKNAYQADKRAFDDAERKADSIRSRIYDRISEVREQFERIEMLVHRFLEYRAIASGDDIMAMQFLVKAFDLSDEDIASIRKHESVGGVA